MNIKENNLRHCMQAELVYLNYYDLIKPVGGSLERLNWSVLELDFPEKDRRLLLKPQEYWGANACMVGSKEVTAYYFQGIKKRHNKDLFIAIFEDRKTKAHILISGDGYYDFYRCTITSALIPSKRNPVLVAADIVEKWGKYENTFYRSHPAPDFDSDFHRICLTKEMQPVKDLESIVERCIVGPFGENVSNWMLDREPRRKARNIETRLDRIFPGHRPA